jgi:zinc protease
MAVSSSRSPLTAHRTPVWTQGVVREVLSNGLTLLIQPDHSASVVALVTHVKAGFFDEPDRWAGISHVLEHMFFKGTRRRGVGAIARDTKAVGGYLNAGTGYDHTSYFTVLPASGLAQALDIQSDALRNSIIDPEELARELQVIIQEAKRKRDTPEAVAQETLHQVMFDRHRIRRWRIGQETELARLTRDDLLAYYRSRYVPERTVVAIVGAIDPAAALDLALKHYADWPATPAEIDSSPEEPPHHEIRARTLRGDVSQSELVVGWRTVPALHEDAPALDLAAGVLGAGRGSLLYQALRESGLVTSTSAHNYTPTELGVFSIDAELEPEKLEPALEKIAECVSRLALLGPSPDELHRARTLLEARWARRLESMEGKASALAAAEALEHVSFLDREYAALLSVDADDVREAAAEYLQPDGVAGVVYSADGAGPDLTPELLGRSFAVTPLHELPRLQLERRRVPPVLRMPASREAGVEHTCLDGIDLLVRHKPGVPLVTLGLYLPRIEFDPAGQAGIGALLARGAVRGAGDMEAAELAFAFEQLGGSLAAVAAADWLGFSTSVLAPRMVDAAVLLDLVLRSPRLRDAEVETERGLMAAEAEQISDDMFRFPFQLGFGEAFGDAGYGLPVSGLPDTLQSITPANVRAWHERVLSRGRPALIAVGDVDSTQASAALAGVFRDYPRAADGSVFDQTGYQIRQNGSSRVVEREKAQTALAMIFPGPDRRSPERFAGEVWAAVASGLGGRMFEALRDRRSLAYTVLASSWQRGRAGALVTYIATSPEREEEARTAMLEQLEQFAREPITEQERSQAVNYLAGQAEISRQSASALASEILECWVIGNGLMDLEDPAGSYRAVTAEEVLQVARQNLDPARRAEGVVRGSGLRTRVDG